MSAGKRVLTGESLFMTAFTNIGQGKKKVFFASPYPGKNYSTGSACSWRKNDLPERCFSLCCKRSSVGIEFQKLGTGLFGGEGFIMQKLEGDGMAFVHAGGHIIERDLQPGELLKIDTGCIVAFTPSCHYDIQFVGGIKNTLFGGEGLFFATFVVRAKYGYKHYRSAVLQAVLLHMVPINEKMKEAFLAD